MVLIALAFFRLMLDWFDEPVPAAPEEPEPSREEAEQWLTRPSHTRSEVMKALDWRVLHDVDLLPVIRSRQYLCDGDPDILLMHVGRRPLLIPAVLHWVAAPSSVEFPKFYSLGTDDEQICRTLFGVCMIWLTERYVPLAHAQIWRLWPEHNLSAVKSLIVEYFGDGYVWRLDRAARS